MKLSHHLTRLAPLAAAGLLSMSAQAASVYLSPTAPAVQTVPQNTQTTASFDLWMDFSAAEATLGGGIDVALGSSLSIGSFTGSTFWTASTDPAFTGFGTTFADHALEIHFGNFNGLSGLHDLGTLTLNVAPMAAGATSSVDLSINSHFGSFVSANAPFGPQVVQLTGGLVQAVPEPDAAWLLLAGLPVLVAFSRRQRHEA